jgi:hypothetical protein
MKVKSNERTSLTAVNQNQKSLALTIKQQVVVSAQLECN